MIESSVAHGDHSINALNFAPDRILAIHVDDATNGAFSVTTGSLTVIKPSCLSGAIFTCPKSDMVSVKYADISNPS